MKKMVLFGSGGFAREVHQIIEDINAVSPTYDLLGFLDGNKDNHGKNVHGLPVLGGIEWLTSPEAESVYVVICIGNTVSKRKIATQIEKETQAKFSSLIHPKAWIGNRVTVGEGSIIGAGCLITTDIVIGKHVIVNIGSTIGHDAILHDYVTIAPTVNISGMVHIGEGVDIGSGSTVIQGKRIGAWSIIGAGAVVVHNIEKNVTAVGTPARTIKSRHVDWHLE